jgi:hypothetical protein
MTLLERVRLRAAEIRSRPGYEINEVNELCPEATAPVADPGPTPSPATGYETNELNKPSPVETPANVVITAMTLDGTERIVAMLPPGSAIPSNCVLYHAGQSSWWTPGPAHALHRRSQ